MMKFFSGFKIVCYLTLAATFICELTFNYAQADQYENSRSDLVYPLIADRVSSKFGTRVHPIKKHRSHHNGIDLAAPRGAHVRAVSGGKIIFAADYKGFGKLITIAHDDKNVSLYGHLHEILVEVGQWVKSGELIGKVGSTGRSTGPHLHFEWRNDGKPVNPQEVLPGITHKAQG